MAEVLFDTQLPLAAHQGLGPRSFPDNRTWTSSCIREASTRCDDFREEGSVLESHLQGLQSIVAMRARQSSGSGLKEQSDIFSTRGLLSLPSGHKQLFNDTGNSYRYCPTVNPVIHAMSHSWELTGLTNGCQSWCLLRPLYLHMASDTVDNRLLDPSDVGRGPVLF